MLAKFGPRLEPICISQNFLDFKLVQHFVESNVIDLHSIQYSIELMLFDKEAKLFSNYFLATGKVFFFFRTKCGVLFLKNILSLKKDLLTIERVFILELNNFCYIILYMYRKKIQQNNVKWKIPNI